MDFELLKLTLKFMEENKVSYENIYKYLVEVIAEYFDIESDEAKKLNEIKCEYFKKWKDEKEYKIGDRFRGKKGCVIQSYENDIFELREDKNGLYKIVTIYSDCGDYTNWVDGRTYEGIKKSIDESLEKII